MEKFGTLEEDWGLCRDLGHWGGFGTLGEFWDTRVGFWTPGEGLEH